MKMKRLSLMNSSLTPEQREKSTLETEDLDMKGVVSRNKVVDQTIFDVMLILLNRIYWTFLMSRNRTNR